MRQHLRVPRVSAPGLAQALVQVASPSLGHAFPPHWGWYVVLYLFLGGLSAGTYFIASLLLFAGDARDREAVRLGYLVSFPLLLVCFALLLLDLGVPLRFWHLLLASERVPAIVFKPWSPISLGSWILALFSVFSSAAFAWALVESGRLRWEPAARAAAWAASMPRPLLAWKAVGMLFSFGLTGYTGVLVSATTIPVWHNARLMGALFLASATSTSYALLMLLLLRRGGGRAGPTIAKLSRADTFSMLLELVLIVVLLLVLGRAARPLVSGGFGVLFWVGVVGLGLLWPLVLHRKGVVRWAEPRRELIAAVCVLVGGLLLRFVVVVSPQFPAVSLWAL